ncbi:hypothetical protein LCGC14_1857720 [marine sediment metagenome]|uniref:Uncharacterized protein n=1 Tax=marine sediment metagenome TaxID=412755 RepID=A0A0F9J7J0_9ZZZZ
MNDYKAETRANNIVSVIFREENMLLSESSAKHIAEEIRYAEQRARAEVLAACLKKLREHEAFVECRKQEHDGIRAGELLIAISAIEQLQPAAKDLEALLREAEVKGIRWAEGRDIAQITTRLNELGKARAEGKG